MIWIPPGPFSMGSNETDSEGRSIEFGLTKPWFEDEGPPRSIHLPGFFIDRLEVTNRDYAVYVRETFSRPPESWGGVTYPPGKDLYPVTEVNWFQAQGYCTWAGKRLPTEAEWEKAARGPEGLIYPWSNRFDLKMANLLTDGLRPVGSFPQGASPYKVEDLIGNVWEWTEDWYQAYPGNNAPSDNYGNQFKVIRGKSWSLGFGHHSQEEAREIMAHQSRASYRFFSDPTLDFGDLGFRCTKDK